MIFHDNKFYQKEGEKESIYEPEDTED
jgi:hypothetical protein